MIAPNASIGIQGNNGGKSIVHRGAFFGQYVELHQDAILRAGFDPSLFWKPNEPPESAGQDVGLQKFVAKLGFLDGTDCSSWPQALTPANYVSALSDTLNDPNGTADVAWLNEQLQGQNIAQLTAIGSPRDLTIVDYVEPSTVTLQPARRWVALDRSAGTGYDISYERLCTVDELNADRCSRRWKTVTVVGAGPIQFQLLGLTAQRERRTPSDGDAPKTVLLVAPTVALQADASSELASTIDLNVNLIVSADQVQGSTSGTPTAIQVKPYASALATNWQNDLAADPKPGLVAVFADQVTGVGRLSALPGVRIGRVLFYDGRTNYSDGSIGAFDPTDPKAADASTNPTIWRYLESYGAANNPDITYGNALLLPKSAAINWTTSYQSSNTSSTLSAMPSWWCARSGTSSICNPNATQKEYSTGAYSIDIKDFQVTYSLTSNAPPLLRKTFGPSNGAALLSLASGANQVDVRAPAAKPIDTRILGNSALPYTLTIGGEILQSLKPEKWSYYASQTTVLGTQQHFDLVSGLPLGVKQEVPKGAVVDRLFNVVDPADPICSPQLANISYPSVPNPDPSNLVYTQYIWNSVGGPIPVTGYYKLVLKCRKMVAANFSREDGTQINAGATEITAASAALTNFIDGTIMKTWSGSMAGAPADNVHKSSNPLLAHAGAQIISNGLYFSTLYSRDDTASLKQSAPVADYVHLSALLDDIDPNGTGAMGINAAIQGKVRTIAATLDPTFTGTRLNALGLPYGNIAAPWAQTWTDSDQPPWALSDVKERWQTLSTLQASVLATVNAGRNRDAIVAALGAVIAIADSVRTYTNTMATSDQKGFVDQSKAYDILKGTLGQLATNQQDYINSLCAATGVTTNCSIENVGIAMQTAATHIGEKCNNAAADVLSWMKTVADLVPVVGGALGIVSDLQTQFKAAGDGDASIFGFIARMTDATLNPSTYKQGAEYLKSAAAFADTAGKVADAFSQVRSGLNQILPKMGLLDGQCDKDSNEWAAQAAMYSQIATANALLETMATQAKTIESISKSMVATLEYLVAERGANLQLACDVDATCATNTNQEIAALTYIAQDIFDDAIKNAEFDKAACVTVRNAVRTASKDLYGISAMLQTSTGRASVQPGLVIPASDATIDQTPPATDRSFSYVTNVWDSSGFTAGFDQGGNTTVSFIESADQSFSNLVLNQMCHLNIADPDPRRSTLFVVRRILDSSEVDQLRATGSVDFNVDLSEFAQAGAESIDLSIAGVSAREATGSRQGQWDIALTPPVVLGVRYSACGSTDCKGALLSEAQAGLSETLLAVMRYRNALVPRTCSPDETPVETTISGKGPIHADWSFSKVVRTCMQAVDLPKLAQVANYIDLNTAPFSSSQLANELTGNGQLCLSLASDQLLVGVRGSPLFGNWTLGAADLATSLAAQWTLTDEPGATSEPLAIPSSVQGIEVLFFVGAQPKPQSVTNVYTLLDPASVLNGH